jgi:hypothetical protein
MINETLNNAEIEIAQDYFKSMLSNKRRAVSKYGADAEKIMWGSAVKRAKKKMEDINTNKIKEAVTKALSYNLDEVVEKIDSMLDEDKIKGSNIKKVGSSWRVVSGKTGKLWPQTYDSKGDAEDAIKAYFANMNEATEEEIERQKEYNAELEKTDSLVSQISTKSQLRETIKSYIKEKLTKKSKVGDFIDDFTKSDAKQFKGKSEKKKQEMAVAAYLAKQNEK